MRRLNSDALLVLAGLVLILVFCLGIFVGATIHAGIVKQAAAAEVAR